MMFLELKKIAAKDNRREVTVFLCAKPLRALTYFHVLIHRAESRKSMALHHACKLLKMSGNGIKQRCFCRVRIV